MEIPKWTGMDLQKYRNDPEWEWTLEIPEWTGMDNGNTGMDLFKSMEIPEWTVFIHLTQRLLFDL